MSDVKFPCLQLAKGEISERVIVCGDPERAEKIAARFDNAKCLVKNREFWTYRGTYKGVDVSVTSHGVGCGGASILFESMWRAGVKAIIRVGTCGGLQPEVKTGDLVIATGACREEGVTEKIIPLSYPAISDGEVVYRLEKASKDLNIPCHKGIVLTQATFYPGFLESKVKLYSKAGVKAMENEVASLLVIASLHGVKAGAIIAADAPAFELVGPEGYEPDQDCVKRAVENEISIALEAIVNVSLDYILPLKAHKKARKF